MRPPALYKIKISMKLNVPTFPDTRKVDDQSIVKSPMTACGQLEGTTDGGIVSHSTVEVLGLRVYKPHPFQGCYGAFKGFIRGRLDEAEAPWIHALTYRGSKIHVMNNQLQGRKFDTSLKFCSLGLA